MGQHISLDSCVRGSCLTLRVGGLKTLPFSTFLGCILPQYMAFSILLFCSSVVSLSTCGGRRPSVEDDLCWILACCLFRFAAFLDIENKVFSVAIEGASLRKEGSNIGPSLQNMILSPSKTTLASKR